MSLMAVSELTRPILICARVSSVVFFFFFDGNLEGEGASERDEEREKEGDRWCFAGPAVWGEAGGQRQGRARAKRGIDRPADGTK